MRNDDVSNGIISCIVLYLTVPGQKLYLVSLSGQVVITTINILSLHARYIRMSGVKFSSE